MPPQPHLAIVATVQQAITSLLTTYEPGRYDFACGYPINANMQPLGSTRDGVFSENC